MSAQRLRRWANIVQMLYECFVCTVTSLHCWSIAHDDKVVLVTGTSSAGSTGK